MPDGGEQSEMPKFGLCKLNSKIYKRSLRSVGVLHVFSKFLWVREFSAHHLKTCQDMPDPHDFNCGIKGEKNGNEYAGRFLGLIWSSQHRPNSGLAGSFAFQTYSTQLCVHKKSFFYRNVNVSFHSLVKRKLFRYISNTGPLWDLIWVRSGCRIVWWVFSMYVLMMWIWMNVMEISASRISV